MQMCCSNWRIAMYDHNVPQCTTEHLRRVLTETGDMPAAPEEIAMMERIDKELKRRAKDGEATLKTFKRVGV